MFRKLSASLICLALAGCAGVGGTADATKASRDAATVVSSPDEAAPKYGVIVRKKAPFYQYGPSQAKGPDFALDVGEIVIVLEEDRGFNRVRVHDGQEGYIPSDLMEETAAPVIATVLPASTLQTWNLPALQETPLPTAAGGADSSQLY